MPMYDYRCRSCGHVFEELVVSSSVPDSEVACPACGARDAERLVSAPRIATGGGKSVTKSGCSPSSGFS